MGVGVGVGVGGRGVAVGEGGGGVGVAITPTVAVARAPVSVVGVAVPTVVLSGLGVPTGEGEADAPRGLATLVAPGTTPTTVWLAGVIDAAAWGGGLPSEPASPQVESAMANAATDPTRLARSTNSQTREALPGGRSRSTSLPQRGGGSSASGRVRQRDARARGGGASGGPTAYRSLSS